MKQTTQVLTSNTNVLLCDAIRNPETNMWEATIFVYGTFGGGTVNLQASPDGGTTKINLRDVTGTVVAVTANDAYNLRLGEAGRNGAAIKVYATISGATSPSVSVDVFDNRS